MRSDTTLSLAEFCLALNGNPWFFAGIDRYGEVKSLSQEVIITLEDPWQTKAGANNSAQAGSNSRVAVADAIRRAERRIAEMTGKYLIPTQICNEMQGIDSPFRTQHVGFVLKPENTPVIQFGVRSSTQAGDDVALTKEDSGILDTFTCTVTVPDNTSENDVRVYLTPSDGNYSGTPQLQHEIRPVSVSINTTTWLASIEIPAYVCVKPSLYSNQRAGILHEADSYVDEVDIWVDSVDVCQSGEFQYYTRVNGLPSDTRVPAAFYDQGDDWYNAVPVTCTNGTFSSTILQRHPERMYINYLAGFARENGRVQATIADIIWMMATGYLAFDEERVNSRENIPTSPLWTTKAKYYREMQVYDRRVDYIGPQESVEKAKAYPAEYDYWLDGLEPRRGPVQAIGDILSKGWVSSTSHTMK